MDDLKNEDNLKNEEYLKKGDGFENWPSPKFFWPPPIPLKNYLIFFLMAFQRDSHTTTDVKSDMLPSF